MAVTMLRFKKIHRPLLILLSMVLFTFLMLNISTEFAHFPNNVELTFNLPYIFRAPNVTAPPITSVDPTTKRLRLNIKRGVIWKTDQGDRISAQLNFFPEVNKSLPPKRILLQQGIAGWNVKSGRDAFVKEQCNVQNCELLDFPWRKGSVDARLFKEIDIGTHNIKDILKEVPRHSEQIWMMFALESPAASPDYFQLDHVINWTATYRPDSTIVTPYDKWLPFGNCSQLDAVKPSRNFAEGKTKSAAIFVSNCETSNKRMQFVRELQKYISVDIYGSCGDKQCEKATQDGCFKMLQKEYRFYLAFENANCRHYITEKLFLNALRYDVLPVVMGAHPADYARAAPPGSYIHVEDFDSPEQLGAHLKKLERDDKLYNDYFRWQSCGRFINTKFWCRVCAMLWDPDRPKLSVPSLQQWWRNVNTCINDGKWRDLDR